MLLADFEENASLHWNSLMEVQRAGGADFMASRVGDELQWDTRIRGKIGMANLDLGSAIAPTSVFRIASTSKQFTAAVMVLADGGAGDLLLLVPSLFMTADVYDRPAIVFGWSQAGMLLPRLRPSQ